MSRRVDHEGVAHLIDDVPPDSAPGNALEHDAVVHVADDVVVDEIAPPARSRAVGAPHLDADPAPSSTFCWMALSAPPEAVMAAALEPITCFPDGLTTRTDELESGAGAVSPVLDERGAPGEVHDEPALERERGVVPVKEVSDQPRVSGAAPVTSTPSLDAVRSLSLKVLESLPSRTRMAAALQPPPLSQRRVLPA